MGIDRGKDTAVGVRLAAWFTERLDGATRVHVENVRRPGAGWSSETLLFDLVYETASGEMVCEALVARLAPPEPGVFPTYDLGLQHRVLGALAATDVPVPALRGVDLDPGPVGSPFLVMRHVAGEAATDTYHATGWLADLSEACRADVWLAGVDLVAAVNRLDWRLLGLGDVDALVRPGGHDITLGGAALPARLASYRDMLDWAERLGRPHPLCEDTLAWLEEHEPEAAGDTPVAVCWGDARLGNILFDAGQPTAVLDWEMVHLGDPVHDLAWYLTLDRCLSEGIGCPRLAGLPGRATTVARWEEQSGHSAGRLAYYEVLSAFEFAVIMLRVMTVYKETGVFPVDSDYDVENLATATLRRLLDEWPG